MKKKRRTKWYREYGPSILFYLLCAVACFFLGRFLTQTFITSADGKEPVPMPTPESYTIIVTPEPEQIDPEEALVQAVITLDHERGLSIECDVSYIDLLLMSKIMQAEKGPYWPPSFVMSVGEVVLNRVASPEYPNTIEEVIYEEGQYEPVIDNSWAEIRPTEEVVRLALRLLKGERVLNDPRVVFQALFPQGSRTIMEYTDIYLGNTTYFCWSNNPELYEEVNG